MTGPEIAVKIKENEDKIESLLDPTSFVLNKEIKKLLEENVSLMKQCPHEYVDGKCIYCHKGEIE